QDSQEYSAEVKNAREQLVRYFKPEFVNRLDDIVVFESLGKEQINAIVQLELDKVMDRAKEQGVSVSFTPALKKYLAEKGFSPQFGARELKRLIQREVERLLAEEILEKKPEQNKKVTITKGKA